MLFLIILSDNNQGGRISQEPKVAYICRMLRISLYNLIFINKRSFRGEGEKV